MEFICPVKTPTEDKRRKTDEIKAQIDDLIIFYYPFIKHSIKVFPHSSYSSGHIPYSSYEFFRP